MGLDASISLAQCWAKTDPATGRPALTVRDHCLVVGCVARALRMLAPEVIQKWLPNGAETLVAAHDIGKITPGFQAKAGKLVPVASGLEQNHAKVSQYFLAQQYADKSVKAWVMSSGGHHGIYPSPTPQLPRPCEVGHGWPQPLREELLAQLISYFGSLPGCPVRPGPILHAFTGFTTFADWIGSNLDWFPLSQGPMTDYYDCAVVREYAEKVVESLHWHARDAVPGLTFSDQFPGFNPRPLQQALVDAADIPGLYIVEAPMGLGKTEAALAAAYRRWTSGSERGLYFALPTQLTSSRIHGRIDEFLRHVVGGTTAFTLTHGNAWLDSRRISVILPTKESDDVFTGLLSWYASGRRALLAPFGTGTIDQALMSVMPVKHSALRLFSLAGKVAIFDEVHSFDPYTSAILDKTVEWLLQLGGTVIVLSATLSKKRRAGLISAAGGDPQHDAGDSYPLITKVPTGVARPQFFAVPHGTISREVRLRLSSAHDCAALESAARAAEAGACVLIIRNTVATAQETFRQVKAHCREDLVKLGLLHSRFPQFQRVVMEEEWMSRLGSDSSRRPRGCILVATQVAEQSVDIDADFLITDLAPLELILQRIGRLHRHHRTRPTGFDEAVCLVLAPRVLDTEASVDEWKEALGPSAWVYPPIALVRALRTLIARTDDVVRLPSDIRRFVEAGAASKHDVSKAERALAYELEEVTLKQLRTVRARDPFRSVAVHDHEGAQTRWNMRPTAYLIILRTPPDVHGMEVTVTFLGGDSVSFTIGQFSLELARAVHRNATRVPRYFVEACLRQQPSWLHTHLPDAVLAVFGRDGTLLELDGDDGERIYELHYHPEAGVYSRKLLQDGSVRAEPGEEEWF